MVGILRLGPSDVELQVPWGQLCLNCFAFDQREAVLVAEPWAVDHQFHCLCPCQSELLHYPQGHYSSLLEIQHYHDSVAVVVVGVLMVHQVAAEAIACRSEVGYTVHWARRMEEMAGRSAATQVEV